MKYKRKSLLFENNVVIYKDEKGQIVDKKTWMKISENRLYLLYDIDHNKINLQLKKENIDVKYAYDGQKIKIKL